MNLLRVGLAAVMSLGLSIAAAIADDSDACRTRTGNPIAACTRVITSPQATRLQVGDAYINRGQHRFERKEYALAIADFDRAIPLKPTYLMMAHGNRGNTYFAMGENEKAIDSYDKAIALDRTYVESLAARGLLYEKAGSIERARADFNAALAATSKLPGNDWGHTTARARLEALKGK